MSTTGDLAAERLDWSHLHHRTDSCLYLIIVSYLQSNHICLITLKNVGTVGQTVCKPTRLEFCKDVLTIDKKLLLCMSLTYSGRGCSLNVLILKPRGYVLQLGCYTQITVAPLLHTVRLCGSSRYSCPRVHLPTRVSQQNYLAKASVSTSLTREM